MPSIALQIGAGDVVIHLAFRTSVFHARLEGAMTAAIQIHRAAVGIQAIVGGDVDDARGAVAVLRGQCAREEIDLVDEARPQRIAETH